MTAVRFASCWAEGPVEIRHDLAGCDRGFWAVVVDFEGEATAVRMERVHREPAPTPPVAWTPLAQGWRSSLGRAAYEAGVREIRARIARGQVYQANLCRVLSYPLPDEADLDGLEGLLRQGNPAPYAARVHLPEAGLDVVCASPEAYLLRDGDLLTSRPIKGTAVDAASMLPKDVAENVMIADLVRHDLHPVCRPGSVRTQQLCALEEHPGLVHLVTTVTGELRPGVGWAEILAATYPPGSVSGAPKHTALQAIRELETAPRRPYCGAIGWIDGDRCEAELAVGIRTFWAASTPEGRELRFGVGAGITWGSDPAGEWAETELKAARLVGLASGRVRLDR